jgi:hypothetical protein
MADTTISGTIHKMSDTQKISESFSKREIVIKTDEPYPQFIPVQFTNKNIDKLSRYKEGSDVVVSYNLRGKEWQSKFFVSIDGWRIENGAFGSSSQSQKEEDSIAKNGDFSAPQMFESKADETDLPF